jgi:hypothetical protein
VELDAGIDGTPAGDPGDDGKVGGIELFVVIDAVDESVDVTFATVHVAVSDGAGKSLLTPGTVLTTTD